jgi:hypothetical protein
LPSTRIDILLNLKAAKAFEVPTATLLRATEASVHSAHIAKPSIKATGRVGRRVSTMTSQASVLASPPKIAATPTLTKYVY